MFPEAVIERWSTNELSLPVGKDLEKNLWKHSLFSRFLVKSLAEELQLYRKLDSFTGIFQAAVWNGFL